MSHPMMAAHVVHLVLASAKEWQLEDHTVLLQRHAEVVYQLTQYYNTNTVHHITTLPLSMPFTCTETETDFIFGALACVDVSCISGKTIGA